MNPSDPLAGLHDIHLPPPISWFPPAPGWWFLILLLAGGLAAAVYVLWRYFRRRAYRRAALRELRELQQAAEIDERERLLGLAALVRRVAIKSCGRNQVAELFGDTWLSFLDRTGRTEEFTSGPGRVLGSELYRPGRGAAAPEGIWPVIGEWIRRHRQC